MKPIKQFHSWIDKIWRDDRYSAAFERRRFLPWKLEVAWLSLGLSGYFISGIIEWLDDGKDKISYPVCIGFLVAALALRFYFFLRFTYFFSFTKNSEEIMKMRREDGGPNFP